MSSDNWRNTKSDGLSFKKTQKVKPLKKIPETDAIFENLAKANIEADKNPKTLRISLDSKAKVKVGNLSRGGKSRTLKPLQADDHDHQWSEVLVPMGILDVQEGRFSIYFGTSAETSDFIVDCLSQWWQDNQGNYLGVEELVINLDNGIGQRSNRSQFIKRIVQFAQSTKLRIHLIYYPPYHSKYNPIERCWAILENYWNGAILDSTEAVLSWASNMIWKGNHPQIHLIKETYQKGIIVRDPELKAFRQFWQCSETLPKWDVMIAPP
ncbi:transposase [Limnoraphis robusta Tam1]|nr:transposase [Limnoraphis robusta]MEA5495952.1 transposase [Limnoraphis robusta BA-68 BA1]MEA5540761.1 transposase [Limnoraphis robusta Tam1]